MSQSFKIIHKKSICHILVFQLCVFCIWRQHFTYTYLGHLKYCMLITMLSSRAPIRNMPWQRLHVTEKYTTYTNFRVHTFPIYTANANEFVQSCIGCSDASTWLCHYNDVLMGAMASEITSLTIIYSTVYSGADQRKRQSSASLAFVRGIHRWPVNSPLKWPVTRKMFPFDDAIMMRLRRSHLHHPEEPRVPLTSHPHLDSQGTS